MGPQSCFQKKPEDHNTGGIRTVAAVAAVVVRNLFVRIIILVVLLRCIDRKGRLSYVIASDRECCAPFESSSASSSSSDSDAEAYASVSGSGRPVLQAQVILSDIFQGISGVDLQGTNVCGGIVFVNQSRAMVEHIPDIIWIVSRQNRGWSSDWHWSE